MSCSGWRVILLQGAAFSKIFALNRKVVHLSSKCKKPTPEVRWFAVGLA